MKVPIHKLVQWIQSSHLGNIQAGTATGAGLPVSTVPVSSESPAFAATMTPGSAVVVAVVVVVVVVVRPLVGAAIARTGRGISECLRSPLASDVNIDAAAAAASSCIRPLASGGSVDVVGTTAATATRPPAPEGLLVPCTLARPGIVLQVESDEVIVPSSDRR
jgi:hypothetical protein